MGEPSATRFWGRQLDGHHMIINYFVLGDQVVMTPVFMGSEPVKAEVGRFKGTGIMQAEQDKGLRLMQAFSPAQQAAARIRKDKSSEDLLSAAYKDNLVLDYAGIRVAELSDAHKVQLLDLIADYVGNLKEGHARVRMAEVRKHLDDTYFGWIGSTVADGVFYCRIHSVVRTPNGNDLLRQHHQRHAHAAAAAK